MCDLIDLKSPDGKTIPGTKLASPLIPTPSETSSDQKTDGSCGVVKTADLFIEKRNSLDNNPFDNAHHKTVEYVRKQDDPFETVLEKALTYEPHQHKSKNTCPRSRIVDFKDDFTPKKRRYSDILKMNKTLDDSITDLHTNNVCSDTTTLPSVPEIIIQDPRKINLEKKEKELSQNGHRISSCRVQSPGLDSSILNQSAMNDSLTESSSSSTDDNLLKSFLGMRVNEKMRCAAKDPGFLMTTDEIPHLQNLRRSLSQGDKTSPNKFHQQRCHSTTDSLKAAQNAEFASNSIMPSILFDDSMNKAFLRASHNNASVFSNLSNVSSISRVTPGSSRFNSSSCSSVFSNKTANCAFIESSSRAKSIGDETSREKDLNELILKYSKLRTRSSASGTNETCSWTNSIVSSSDIGDAKPVSTKTEDKLIDVDVFVPQPEGSPDSFQRESSSGTSTDSVFVDSDTIEKSIFNEAKSLAKTFEELASKTGSSVSSDDLINSRPNWNFDMLPASDEDSQVDDLIELQKSPCKQAGEESHSREESAKSASSSDSKLEEKNVLKDWDTNFRDPENKIIASSLLLDLEKLVKSEANSEAAELLKSLEKALGVKCASNVDLLATCLTSERNNLEKSTKKSESIGGTENIKDENVEKSREDNNDIDALEIFKQPSSSDYNNFNNNLNIDKEINKSDKSPLLVSEKYQELSAENDEKNTPNENTCGEFHDDSIEALKQQNQMTNDQKIAVEILVGLGKLLTGENKDPKTANLLKNLGIALNLASSYNSDPVAQEESPVKENKRVGTPVKNRMATPPRKSTPLSLFSRSANRKSLNLKSKEKPTNDRTLRRSISVTQTSSSTTPNIPRLANTPLSADKSKAHLKDARKRFPSDPSSDGSSVNARKLAKDLPIKPAAVSELARQDKPSSTMVSKVKNRFRKKVDSDLASKKGPMKAVIPLGNMQRRGSLAKRDPLTAGSVTPPKPGPTTYGVTTSTPFGIPHFTIPAKKSPKSKPMASSTPDDIASKHLRRSASQIPQSPGKNTLFCSISPVTSKNAQSNEDNPSHNNSVSSKTSRIATPSKSRQSSQLPRLSPMLGTKASSPKLNRGQRRSEPLQSCLPKSFTNTPKSPRERNDASDGATSPLNNSNKLGSAVKPLNLISKLGRRKTSVAEKENYS